MPWDLIFGGITGLVGTVWSGYNNRKIKELDIKDRELDRAHELKMVDAETAQMVAETEASIRVTEVQTEGALQIEEARAYGANQAAANKPTLSSSLASKLFATTGWIAALAQPAGVLICVLFGVADTVKALARPSITTYLLGLSTWMTVQAWRVLELNGQALSTAQASVLVSDTTRAVLYLTTTAVTWWFGDRMAAKGAAKILGVKR